MKIGINATFLYEKPTGACLVTREVSRIIAERHKDTIVFSPIEYNDLPPDSVYKVPEGLKGSQRLSNNLFRFFYINTVLPMLCKLKGVDVLYCPILEFPFIPSVPLVVHIHDLHFIHFSSEFGLAAPRMKFSLKMIKRVVGRVVVSSRFVKDELLRSDIVGEDFIDTVPLSYDSDLFKPVLPEGKEDFFKRYSLSKNYILFVGSLFPYKNLKILIEAFLKIKDRIPHSLVVVGRREFSTALTHDERILYLDYVSSEDLPMFYSCADLFVYPSLMEGFGIPPLEAMACGTPVISSNRGSLPEVVGDAGILFNPEDSRSLSELILKVINNEGLRRELIEKGLHHVKRFSWEKTAEGIIKSCEKALKGK